MVTTDDPEANGLAEAGRFGTRPLLKRKIHIAEINKYLFNMRTTPYLTTKKSPAELMYNCHIRTRLPQTTSLIGERGDIDKAREENRTTKLKQKKYKESKRYVKPYVIKIGDQVLLKQKAENRGHEMLKSGKKSTSEDQQTTTTCQKNKGDGISSILGRTLGT